MDARLLVLDKRKLLLQLLYGMHTQQRLLLL